MKIRRISVFQRDLPLAHPYFLSGGRLRFDQLDSTFVRIETDTGLIGWGEGCPWGHTYLPAHGPGLRAAVGILAPALIGEDPRALWHLNRLMDRHLPGHNYAKSPLDIACWDILGQSADMPLWQLMGGTGSAVSVNSSISTGTPAEMVENIETHRAQGYRTHSAKLGGSDPQTDIARIEAIEAALIPGEFITYDINRAWTPGVALQVLNAVPSTSWVEQPCETLAQCAQVARSVRQPVLLDECLHSFQDHLDAHATGVFGGLKVKPNRLGGLTKCLQVRDFAIAVGWQMHIEDTGGTVMADTAALHLASATPEEFHMDSWLAHAHNADDPFPGQGARNSGGKATLPDLPGLGVVPPEGSLGAPVEQFS